LLLTAQWLAGMGHVPRLAVGFRDGEEAREGRLPGAVMSGR
jgi:hypothetical protein